MDNANVTAHDHSTFFTTLPSLLAQSDGTAPPASAANGEAGVSGELQDSALANDGSIPSATPGLFDSPLFLMMVLFLVLLWVFMLRGTSKEKKKRQQLLDTMGKGDRVQTVGGILGTVVEIKDDEVLLKVDENANTKLRFSRAAIQTIISEKPDKPDTADQAADKDEKSTK